jgi:hypothetical protein
MFPEVRAKGFSATAALAALAMSCLTVPAQAAEGLEPGVHTDPGSPAAKEYALPINQARQTGTAPGHASTGSAALFGAGIKPPGSGGGSGQGSSTNAENALHGVRHDGSGHGASGAAPSHPQPSLPAAVLRAERSPTSSSDSSMLALLGGGAAILVLGAFVGTIMKRGNLPSGNNRPSAST